jgi:ethanolamine transporter EutH
MAVLVVLSVISIILCYLVAKERRANTTFWVIAGLIVGPLAIPFVFFSKPVAKSE